MTPIQINEGNLAIAQFMGWVKPDKRNKTGYRVDIPYQLDTYEPLFVWEAHPLAFHLEWNWLMLAWQKVSTYHQHIPNKSLYTEMVTISPGSAIVMYCWTKSGHEPESEDDSFIYYPDEYEGRDLLQCVFLAVSDFCKLWRDKQMPV